MRHFPQTSNQMDRRQRRVLVALGTLVVLMAALAVGLVIRNALDSSGLTGQPTGSGPDSPTVTSAAVASPTTSTTLSESPSEPSGSTAATVPGALVPTLPPPPATFVEETISASDLRIQPEGLGPIPFGTEATRAMATLTAALGSPASDTGWLPAGIDRLRCPGVRARHVSWGSLDVFFSDGPTDWGPGRFEHFFAFSYSLAEGASSPSGPSLRTSEGLQLGSTLARASAIYGDSSLTLDHPTHGAVLEVDVPGPGHMLGIFTGPGEEDLLVYLRGGAGCGE